MAMMTARESFCKPEIILSQVKKKVNKVLSREVGIDYPSFVPDGEPTLDINLGTELLLLKQIGIPRAVITNSSMIWQGESKKRLARS